MYFLDFDLYTYVLKVLSDLCKTDSAATESVPAKSHAPRISTAANLHKEDNWFSPSPTGPQ